MATYTTIDCCPVDVRFEPLLRVIKEETGCVYQSIYRGQDAGAQKYLTGNAPCYKHNQAWIYAHYPPGVANPPDRSTHECRSDGVAYLGPIGRKLFWWQCGIDVDNAHVQALIRAAAKHGWRVSITYPNSPVEYHHVNFRKEPVYFKALKLGDRGPRVRTITHRLTIIRDPTTHKPYLTRSYWTYTKEVEAAIKAFQKDHHQKADGIYGSQTSNQLRTSYNWWKNKTGRS